MKTWEDIKIFDDVILEEERMIIKELENKNTLRCPDLSKQGNFFYYCAHNLGEVKPHRPSPSSPIYRRHVGVAELQLDCMGDHEKCCFYQNKIKR